MKSQQPNIKVLIAGGGTGGHIFPAIAIANHIKKEQPDADILFVGSKDRMEMERVPAAGYPIKGLWISGLQRKLTLKNLMFPLKVLHSLWKSFWIIKRFKPNVVVGVGGYSSGPVIYMATLLKIPALIQEQNSYAGITNKLVAKRVQRICVAYDKMERYFPKENIIHTGNPIRKEIRFLPNAKTNAREHFQLAINKTTLLVIGGSLGARTINESILQEYSKFEKENIQVIWQTGKLYYDFIVAQFQAVPNYLKIMPFITDMSLAYEAADVIISRAGAISISELCLVGKPVILVPSPNVAEDHQTKNALALVDKEAALLVKDKEAKEKLVQEVIELVGNQLKQQTLGKQILKLGKPNASEDIVQEVIKLAAGGY